MLIDLTSTDEEAADLCGPIYLLGVGGPEDESGIGDVSSFSWRFSLLEIDHELPIALGFRAMPTLMAFTRAVNGERPFTVPTEAMRTELSSIASVPVRLAIDPTSSDLAGWLQSGRLITRKMPGLEG